MSEIALVQKLIDTAINLPRMDYNAVDALEREAAMIIRRVFGDSSHYLEDLRMIQFLPMVLGPDTPRARYHEAWDTGKGEMLNLVQTMLKELETFGRPVEHDQTTVAKPKFRDIFTQFADGNYGTAGHMILRKFGWEFVSGLAIGFFLAWFLMYLDKMPEWFAPGSY